MPFSAAARAMGEQDANRLRYAAPTGTVVMRWDGARQPEIWSVPAPDMEPHKARLDLARRYVHVFGPATPEAFATWAGIRPARGSAAFVALSRSLTPVRTPFTRTGQRDAVEAEAGAFPLPGINRPISMPRRLGVDVAERAWRSSIQKRHS